MNRVPQPNPPTPIHRTRPFLIGMCAMALLMVSIPISYIVFFNSSVSQDNGVVAQAQSNKNSYDSFWKRVQETAQVTTQHKEDFKEVLATENLTSKALIQWMQARDVRLSENEYLQLMRVIEAGRNDFKRGQDELLDRQRRYRTHLDSFWGSIWVQTSGHPRELRGELAPSTDLDGDGRITCLDYPIVTSAKTETAFKTRQDDAIQVFPK